MLHTHEVEGSSPPVSTKKKTTPFGVVFLFYRGMKGTRKKNATRTSVACRRLDGGNTSIFSEGENVNESPSPKGENVNESPNLHVKGHPRWFVIGGILHVKFNQPYRSYSFSTSSAVLTPSEAPIALKDAAAVQTPIFRAWGIAIPFSAAYRIPAQKASPAPTVPWI